MNLHSPFQAHTTQKKGRSVSDLDSDRDSLSGVRITGVDLDTFYRQALGLTSELLQGIIVPSVSVNCLSTIMTQTSYHILSHFPQALTTVWTPLSSDSKAQNGAVSSALPQHASIHPTDF